MASDPFEKFTKQKSKDNLAIDEMRKRDLENLRTRFELYASNHKQILARLNQFNPEPIIARLFDAGFKENKGYPHAQVRRKIHRAVFTDDGQLVYEDKEYGTSDEKYPSDVVSEIKQLTSEREQRRWKQDRNIKANVRIFVTSITWHLILWYSNEYIAYDTMGDVPYGTLVKIGPDSLTVNGSSIESLSSEDFAEVLADKTEAVISGNNAD